MSFKRLFLIVITSLFFVILNLFLYTLITMSIYKWICYENYNVQSLRDLIIYKIESIVLFYTNIKILFFKSIKFFFLFLLLFFYRSIILKIINILYYIIFFTFLICIFIICIIFIYNVNIDTFLFYNLIYYSDFSYNDYFYLLEENNYLLSEKKGNIDFTTLEDLNTLTDTNNNNNNDVIGRFCLDFNVENGKGQLSYVEYSTSESLKKNSDLIKIDEAINANQKLSLREFIKQSSSIVFENQDQDPEFSFKEGKRTYKKVSSRVLFEWNDQDGQNQNTYLFPIISKITKFFSMYSIFTSFGVGVLIFNIILTLGLGYSDILNILFVLFFEITDYGYIIDQLDPVHGVRMDVHTRLPIVLNRGDPVCFNFRTGGYERVLSTVVRLEKDFLEFNQNLATHAPFSWTSHWYLLLRCARVFNECNSVATIVFNVELGFTEIEKSVLVYRLSCVYLKYLVLSSNIIRSMGVIYLNGGPFD